MVVHRIGPVLDELSACLCAALGGEQATCFCGVLIGQGLPVEHLWGDDCGEVCGAGYVRLESAGPPALSAEEDGDLRDVQLEYAVYVGVIRCAPVSNGESDPIPSKADVLAYSQLLLEDMKTIEQVVRCCLQDTFDFVDVEIGSFTVVNVEGGVGGGEWRVTIRDGWST